MNSVQGLTGSWRNVGDDNQICGIMDHGNGRFTLIDEQGKRGNGRIEGNRLTLTYDEFAGPGKAGQTHVAAITENGSRLQWGEDGRSFWIRKPDYAQVWLLNMYVRDQQDNWTKGRDDVYIVPSVGVELLPALPQDTRGEWSLNKENDLRDQLLWDGPLREGESKEISFTVMERDKSKTEVMEAFGKALQEIGKRMRENQDKQRETGDTPPGAKEPGSRGKKKSLGPVLEGLGKALEALSFLGQDRDDHLGSFSVSLLRRNGLVVPALSCSDEAHSRILPNASDDDPHAGLMQLFGSNALYDVWVYPVR